MESTISNMVAKVPDIEFYDVEEGKGATAPEDLKRTNENKKYNVLNSLVESKQDGSPDDEIPDDFVIAASRGTDPAQRSTAIAAKGEEEKDSTRSNRTGKDDCLVEAKAEGIRGSRMSQIDQPRYMGPVMNQSGPNSSTIGQGILMRDTNSGTKGTHSIDSSNKTEFESKNTGRKSLKTSETTRDSFKVVRIVNSYLLGDVFQQTALIETHGGRELTGPSACEAVGREQLEISSSGLIRENDISKAYGIVGLGICVIFLLPLSILGKQRR